MISSIPRSKLYSDTIGLLVNRPSGLTLRIISDDTGLPQAWLWSLISKPHIKPSADRLEHLFNYLSRKQP